MGRMKSWLKFLKHRDPEVKRGRMHVALELKDRRNGWRDRAGAQLMLGELRHGWSEMGGGLSIKQAKKVHKSMTEARAAAWATRRKKYGPSGSKKRK